MTNQELLVKVKNDFSIDFDDKDGSLLSLIEAVRKTASRKTGIDFEVEEMPADVANSIVENVGHKFNDGGFVMDVSVFQSANRNPMF